MRYSIFFVFCCLLPGCSPLTDVTYYRCGQYIGSDVDKVLKITGRTNRLNIQQFRDSVFPNDIVCGLKGLNDLGIDNFSFYFFDTYSEHRAKNPGLKRGRINNVEYNTSCLDSLTALKKLWLSGFKSDEFPYELSHLQSLEELTLSFSEIKNMPTDLTAFKKLKTLRWGEYGCINAPDSILLPPSLMEVGIWAENMSLEDRVKLIKAICRNPHVESIGFYVDEKDIDTQCYLHGIIEKNALNEKARSTAFSVRVKCNAHERAKSSSYRYN